MEPLGRSQLAERYPELLLRAVREGRGEDASAACEPRPAAKRRLPPGHELECLWADGMLPTHGRTVGGAALRVLEPGVWNRGEGPDFLQASRELGGRRVTGDVELDGAAGDWEACGRGEDARFDGVALHVVFTEPPPGWFTRNARHEEVPVFYVPPEECPWLQAQAASDPGLAALGLGVAPEGAAPLENLRLSLLVELLQAAAARRVERKRRLFRLRRDAVGEEQAWYEALAATLGYSANKEAMLLLARRAPLARLKEVAGCEEAALFGAAGFLVPVLPARAGEEARAYHREVWDAWWPLRARFGLEGGRCVPWRMGSVRPLNHPHRRVAALALAVRRWGEIFPLLCIEGAERLSRLLASLGHPYWESHSSLPSAPLASPAALMGASRVREFLANHVYVQDESAESWQAYLCLGAAELSRPVAALARRFLGERRDARSLLRLCFAQQALLELAAAMPQGVDAAE